jgi:hypothetical protein
MKQRLETATEATAKLVSRNGAESVAELLNAPELLTANDAAFRAPIKGTSLYQSATGYERRCRVCPSCGCCGATGK